MLSQTLQSALNNAETALTTAQTAAKAEADGKSALETATKNDKANIDALQKANDDLATARKAVIDAATAEFTLSAADGANQQASGDASSSASSGSQPAKQPAS